MFFGGCQWRFVIVCLWLLAWPAAGGADASASDAVTAAGQAIHSGHYEAAVQALEPWLEAHPKDARAWFLVGVAYARAHRYPLAMDAFRKVSALKPDLVEPHVNLAAVYHALGNDAMAISELDVALMLKPDSPRIERDLAELHLREALRHYKKALKRAPDARLRQRYAWLRELIEAGSGRAGEAGTGSTPTVHPALPETAAVTPPLPASMNRPAGAPRGMEPNGAKARAGAEQNGGADEAERLTEVLDAIENWRAAWSARDLARYFSAYADDFQPPARFGSLAAWKRYKRRVIGNKRRIQVALEQVRVTFSPDGREAVARFMQHYRADSYRSDDAKKLTLARTAKGWKIVREEAGP